MGQSYGYARVSTGVQELALQIDALQKVGVPVENIVQEKRSGKGGSHRPLFNGLIDKLAEGDRLVVWKIDRLGRNSLEVQQVAQALADCGVQVEVTTLGVTDLRSPAGKLIFVLLAQVAEMEHANILERVHAGLEAAKKRGVKLGRRNRLSQHQRSEAARMHTEGKTLGEIAATFGCGKTVIHRAINGENRVRDTSPASAV